MKKIFISYSRKDTTLRAKLAEIIKALGYIPSYDVQEFFVGQPFKQQIVELIDEAACTVVVWTSNSQDSDYVRMEAQISRDALKYIPIRVASDVVPEGFTGEHILDWAPNGGQDEFRSALQHSIERTAGIAKMAPHQRAKFKTEMSRRHLFRWIGGLTSAVAIGGLHYGPSLLKAMPIPLGPAPPKKPAMDQWGERLG